MDRNGNSRPSLYRGGSRGENTRTGVAEEIWKLLYPGMQERDECCSLPGESGGRRRVVRPGMFFGFSCSVFPGIQENTATDVPFCQGTLLGRYCKRHWTKINWAKINGGCNCHASPFTSHQ